MANKHTLSATPRTTKGRKVKLLRQQGQTPANIFGKSVESTNVQVDSKEFEKLFKIVGESTLVYLDVKGEKEARPVLVREVTIHPVTGHMLHIDFNQVSLKEKVTAPVAIHLIDEAPAELQKLGIMVQQLNEVEIEALPADMPLSLEVSVKDLAAVGDAILVKDLVVDSNLSLKTDPEVMVVKIEALAKEEVVEAPVAAEGTAEGAEAPVAAEATAEETKAEEKPE